MLRRFAKSAYRRRQESKRRAQETVRGADHAQRAVEKFSGLVAVTEESASRLRLGRSPTCSIYLPARSRASSSGEGYESAARPNLICIFLMAARVATPTLPSALPTS